MPHAAIFNRVTKSQPRKHRVAWPLDSFRLACYYSERGDVTLQQPREEAIPRELSAWEAEEKAQEELSCLIHNDVFKPKESRCCHHSLRFVSLSVDFCCRPISIVSLSTQRWHSWFLRWLQSAGDWLTGRQSLLSCLYGRLEKRCCSVASSGWRHRDWRGVLWSLLVSLGILQPRSHTDCDSASQGQMACRTSRHDNCRPAGRTAS